MCVSDPTSLALHSSDASSGDGENGGQMELSQQFGCSSPSELSKHRESAY